MGKGTAFLGRLARMTVRGLARVYYPNIEITGRERLPAEGPLLLTANHQNSMLDPVMVGIAARRPVRFLAKAPLFQIPIFGNVLHALGMMPAYRKVDDPTQTRRNLESLGLAAARLKSGEAVGIFPEGKSHDALRLEPVKTGAARMAIQAVQEGAAGLKLIPIGLNYQRKEQFRSAVWIRVGEPIDVKAWLAEHPGDDRQAARELTSEIDRRLKELVVHLDEQSWEPLLNELEVLLPPPRESARNPFAWLRQRKRLADAMNHFGRTEPARAAEVAGLLQRGQERLKEAGLTAHSSVLRQRGWRLTLRLLGEAVLMDLGFILVLIGTLHHLLPFLLTRFIARFVQAPGRSTISLARFGLGIPIYGAWYGFNAWWISSYFLPWVAWAWLLPMPFAGLLALQYWRRVKRTSPAWWRNLAIALQPARLKVLRTEHERLRQLLQGDGRRIRESPGARAVAQKCILLAKARLGDGALEHAWADPLFGVGVDSHSHPRKSHRRADQTPAGFAPNARGPAFGWPGRRRADAAWCHRQPAQARGGRGAVAGGVPRRSAQLLQSGRQ
jgi:glycerol-3-phosphate O-acyltransferase/dihydroxyacetone phosphate acyltransferase